MPTDFSSICPLKLSDINETHLRAHGSNIFFVGICFQLVGTVSCANFTDLFLYIDKIITTNIFISMQIFFRYILYCAPYILILTIKCALTYQIVFVFDRTKINF